MIFKFLNKKNTICFKESKKETKKLRYGENPHQQGYFGNLNDMFDQLNGKELSYNNLLDIDAAVNLISEFSETTFAILKHNNACGISSRESLNRLFGCSCSRSSFCIWWNSYNKIRKLILRRPRK